MSTLTAITSNDEIGVEDSEGGIWWPNEEAAEEIMAAEDPAAAAVEMCETDPMRGVWHS